MGDADRFGSFPSTRVISTVFTRADRFDRGAAAAEFGCGMLEPLAGLVVAHRKMAAARLDWDEVVMTWAPGDPGPVLSATETGADPFTCAWEEVQRHMLSIDLEARRVLGQPPADAVTHHEGLGAIFGRMAHLYTISHDRFVLDGPEGGNRRRLAREYAAYESLARDLACGRKYLPSSAGRPAS